MAEVHDLSSMRSQVEARRNEEMELFGGGPPSGGGEGVSSAFVQECAGLEDLGDGLLYCALNTGRYVFNKSGDNWMRWVGHHWELDLLDMAIADVELVADRYLMEADALGEKITKATKKGNKDLEKHLRKSQDKILAKARRLRQDQGRNACIKFSKTNNTNALAIKGDEIDTQPLLLACANGVVDLEKGTRRDGLPEDYLLRASPVDFVSLDEPCPEWEKTLLEIYDGDEDLIAFLQRLFGYSIMGVSIEHVLPVFYGAGRNGKSLLFDVIKYVLGPLAGPVQPELLLDQGRARSSSGPSADIMTLRGLRLAIASETDENRRFSTATVKRFTGGDPIVARAGYDRYETTWDPTHTLFLLTNNKPHASAEDYAFWQRVYLINHPLSFVPSPSLPNERPVDRQRGMKLKAEASGILAWLVRGCLEYQRMGLQPPDVVREAVDEYRSDEDIIADFLDENCRFHKHFEESASALYERFCEWFLAANLGRKPWSQKIFGGKLTKKGFESRKSGTKYWLGLKLKEKEREQGDFFHS
ncbi:DNA primase family protein [Desulfovibrio inopinatus]|uniref:DNA primase family protein n=1 Tax=Desulfovibrio inopinatus TaxID=102109 RepID=UPI00040112CC|nr:phage/plasmid primase, P4 family [Desulfovibrio inopinatus]